MAEVKLDIVVNDDGSVKIRKVGDELDKAHNRAESARKSLLSMGGAIQQIGIGFLREIGAELLRQVMNFPALVAQVGDYAGALLKMEAALGVTTEGQQILAAAGEDVGISIEKQWIAIQKMQQNLAKSPELLKSVGLAYDDIKNLKPEEQFEAIGKAVAGIENPIKRTQAAMAFFGKSGTEVMPLFSGAIETARENVEKFGLAMDKGTAESIDRLADNLGLGQQAMEGWVRSIIGAIASSEPFQVLVEGLLDLVARFGRHLRDNQKEIASWVSSGAIVLTDALVMVVDATQLASDTWDALRLTGRSLYKIILDIGIALLTIPAALSGKSQDAIGIYLRQSLTMLKAEKDAIIQSTGEILDSNKSRTNSIQNVRNAMTNLQATVRNATASGVEDVKKLSSATGGLPEKADAAAKAFDKFKDSIAGGDIRDKLRDFGRALEEGVKLTPEAAKQMGETIAKAIANNIEIPKSLAAEKARVLATQFSEEAVKAFDSIKKIDVKEMFAGSDEFSVSDNSGMIQRVIFGAESPEVVAERAKKSVEEIKKILEKLGITVTDTQKRFLKWESVSDKISKVIDVAQQFDNLLDALGVSAESTGRKMLKMGMEVGQAGADFAKAYASGDMMGMISSGIKGVTALVTGIKSLFGGAKKAAQEAAAAAAKVAAEVDKNRTAYIKAAGGIDTLKLAAKQAGITLDKLFNAKTVADYDAAVEELTNRLNLNKQANEELNAAMEKYGITIDQLGPKFAQQRLDEQAMSLLREFELLKAAGVDLGLIYEKMGPEFNKYVQTVIAAGGTIPEAMRPIIEEMIRLGTLTDAAGNKIDDIDKVKFAPTMTEAIVSMTKAIKELIDALLGIPRETNYTVTGTYNRREEGGDEGGRGDGGPGFAFGGIVNAPMTGQRVTVHGQEAIVPLKTLFGQLADTMAARMQQNGGGGPSGERPVFYIEMPDGRFARGIERAQKRGTMRVLPTAVSKF